MKVIYTRDLRRDAFDGHLVYSESERGPFDPNSDFYGFYSWENKNIYVNYPKQENSLRLFETILHEVLHAIAERLSLPEFFDKIVDFAI